MRWTWIAGAMFATLGCGSEAGKPSPSASPSSSVATVPAASASSAVTPSPVTQRRATFAIRRMADEFPVVSRSLQHLPVGASFFDEGVPVGLRRMEVPPNMIEKICGGGLPCEKDGKKAFFMQPMQEIRSFLRIVAQDGETPEAAIERLRAYLAGFAPPDRGIEYAFGRLVEIDSETKKLHVVGARSYAVIGPSPVTEADITSVVAKVEAGPASVEVQFTDDAAGRFATFTGDSVYRRIALIVDGNVVAAPLVSGAISGGSVSVVLSQDETSTEADRQQATDLATALGAPKAAAPPQVPAPAPSPSN